MKNFKNRKGRKMKRRVMRGGFMGLSLFIILFIVPFSVYGTTEGDIKKTFNVGSGGQLRLESDIGSIDVYSIIETPLMLRFFSNREEADQGVLKIS